VPGCDTVAACFAYAGAARALLLALKYRNRRDALDACASAVARLAPAVDVVTWAPTVPRRARERGFDQAELLARAVARQLGVPARRLLRRESATAQTGRSAAARRGGPQFRCRPVRGEPLGRVLLVDDIGTTGATLAGAAAALRAAGAAEVHARTVAWTPPRGAHRLHK
jgi:predicted amidophosphoribosyltransferase